MADSDQNTVGDYERGAEFMRKLWGDSYAEQMREAWRALDPDIERYVTAFTMGEIWRRPHLDAKTRSLITLSAAVALERESQIRLHTHGALESGATPAEIIETVIHLMIYASFPAVLAAAPIVRQVIDEHAKNQGTNKG